MERNPIIRHKMNKPILNNELKTFNSLAIKPVNNIIILWECQ